MITKPMLAPNDSWDIQKDFVTFPCIGSPKIDGFRCYIKDGIPLTRSGKVQPNKFIERTLTDLPCGLDGELTAGDFRESTSHLRRYEGEPDFTYHIFDYVTDLNKPYLQRLEELNCLELPLFCKILPQYTFENMEQLLEFEQWCLNEGYEGVMVRKPNGKYKTGRSTLKEGLLIKVKRFDDAEAIITGFIEQEENQNEAFENELGYTSRSTHKENMIGKNTLGALTVKDCKTGVEFKLGSGIGWTKEFKQEIWNNQANYVGKIITYKSLPCGGYDLPRNATMKGFRESWDMGE